MKGIRLTPALIVLDALLAIMLAALWLAPGLPAHWRNWQAPAPQPPNIDDARAALLTPNPALQRDYPAIAERPLFAPDRKPHAAASDAPAAAAAAPPPDSLDQAKLYGLVDGPATHGVLLEQNGQPQFVRRGQKVGDWTLQAIEGRDAIFVKDGQQRTVSLPDSLTVPASAASAAAPAPNASAPVPDSAASQLPPQPHPSARPQPMPGHAPPPPAASRFGGRAASGTSPAGARRAPAG